jgi:thiamine biosynthesis lipoprotein
MLSGCADSVGDIREFRGTTMGTTYTIKYVGEEPVSAVQTAVDEELRRFNLVFSTFIAQSEISRFNVHPAAVVFPVSELFSAVVSVALGVAESTGGAFDPTVMPLVRAYGFGPGGERKIPDDTELETIRERIGWQKLELGADGLEKSVTGVELDLSAIAKGAGVDRVAELLLDRMLNDFMVEIGGEVYCAGEKAPGDPWVIGVEGPPGAEPLADRVALTDRAMATSGTYRNFLEGEAGPVHHVLDPRTGQNADNGVVSVSVIATNCALADALATALMVLGPDGLDGVSQAYEEQGIRVLFLISAEDGSISRLELNW